MSALPPLRISLSTSDIPALPATRIELLQLANDPNVALPELERCIARDQALTLRVLTVANASFYGCARQIGSIRGAIALLGTRQIQSIAAALTLAPVFDGVCGPALWRHALATALWTSEVSQWLGMPAIDYLFTTALMHDIGIVFLSKRLGEDYDRYLVDLKDGHGPLHEIENEHLGCDHASVGATLGAAWNLPQQVTRLIAEHHQPGSQWPDTAASVLAVADYLADASGLSVQPGMEPSELDSLHPETLQLKSDAMGQLLARGDRVVAQVAGFG